MADSTSIAFTIMNRSSNDIVIRYITYTDDSNVDHVADYSVFGGSPVSTFDTTLDQYKKRYLYGDYIEKTFQSDTRDVIVNYSTMTGAVLTATVGVNGLGGIASGWVASGNVALNGRVVQTVIPPDTLVLDGTYVGTPVIGTGITFSTSTYQLILNNTDNLQAGWKIIQNGYIDADNAFITSVVNGTTIKVNKLPNTGVNVVGNPMLFFSTTTNNLSLNNTDNLQAGFTAKTTANAAYDDSQSIVSLVGDGHTVSMTAPPGSTLTGNQEITFTSNNDLYTLIPGASATFMINYSSTGPVGTNYPSVVTVYAKLMLPSPTPLSFIIRNYISVEEQVYVPPGTTPAPWVPPTPPIYTSIYIGGGEGRNGKSYTTTVYTYADGSTISITADSVTNQIISISSTPSTNLNVGIPVISYASSGWLG